VRRVALATTLVAVAAGCGSTHTSRSYVVSVADARIGPLQLDVSDRAAVVAFAGKPQLEARGHMPLAAPYDALGYGCSRRTPPGSFPLAPEKPFCRTIFWINERTGRLETFFTGDPRYAETHGTRVGTATAVAERLLHKRLLVGCEENLYFTSTRAYLTIAFAGGRYRLPSRHVVGGHVVALVLHSRRSDPGVFDCE